MACRNDSHCFWFWNHYDLCFHLPSHRLSTTDGKCRIGLPLKVTILLLSFNAIINLALTRVFFYLLQPPFSFSGLSNTSPLRTNRLTSCIRCVLKTKEWPDSDYLYPMNKFSEVSRNVMEILDRICPFDATNGSESRPSISHEGTGIRLALLHNMYNWRYV